MWIPRSLFQRGRAPVSKAGRLSYRCNICDQGCETKVAALAREEPSCPRCRSTVRARSVIHVLSIELFGASLSLSEFPVRHDIRGMGLSDWSGYATRLARKLNYTNTYYHAEPRLDITGGVDPALAGTLDFLIASDVFEHVAPPASRAFEASYKLLKPAGVLVFTVPYTKDGPTKEHYPELYRYEVVQDGSEYVLKNTTRDGREQVFRNLMFHGGVGETLELRLFSEAALLEEFQRAGFSKITVYRDPDFEHGVYWNPEWSGGSFPMSVRK